MKNIARNLERDQKEPENPQSITKESAELKNTIISIYNDSNYNALSPNSKKLFFSSVYKILQP